MTGVAGKRLLILGGNSETGKLVQEANEMGVLTLVVDPNPDAPAKEFAAEHYEIDGFDVDRIVELAKRLHVDGVLVGVADILVGPYQKICEQLNLPCYASPASIEAFSRKDGFREACHRYGIKDIPGELIEKALTPEQLVDLNFPVMVKPVDNGGGVGMRVCNSFSEIEESVNFALSHSKQSKLLVERYMGGDDMFAYYTFRNGKAYLSATADRLTSKNQNGLSPVCLAAKYPSKHTADFVENVHPRLKTMFEGIGVRDGILNIQFFVENGEFFAYDPGFRLQGEAPHIYLVAKYGFDHRRMLINFALTGSMESAHFQDQDTFDFKNQVAGTFWILLKAGKISEIKGLDVIAADSHVISIVQRLAEGDSVESDMLGTERQVLARIYVLAPSIEVLRDISNQLESQLRIHDESGEDLILDWVDSSLFM